MARKAFSLVALLAVSIALGAEELRIAVMDFSLESDNPQFKYLGKGFTELTSVEVARLPGVILVDRERRNALLEEQSFSLSGVADGSNAITIGNLLSVDYLVTGSIIDMFGNLVVSYAVVNTETGAIVGKRSAEGAPTDYKRIVREIGAGIAEMTGKTAVAIAAAPPPPPAEKQAAVLANFSEAVAALDEKDVKKAAAKLEEARKIDPTDPAVRFYLDKLSSGSSKFAVIPAAYFAIDNPAILAYRREDQLYAIGAMSGPELVGENWNTPGFNYKVVPYDGLYGNNAPNSGGLADRYAVREIMGGGFFGYTFPVGSNLGIGAQVFSSHVENNVLRNWSLTAHKAGWDSIDFSGGVLSVGWAPLPWLALGFGATGGSFGGWVKDPTDLSTEGQTKTTPEFFYGGEFGLFIKSPGGRLAYSLVAGTSSYTVHFFDMWTLGFADSVQWPVYIDTSLSYGFNRMRDFVVLKYIAELYGQEGGPAPFFQVLPAYEHWFGTAVSVRAGGVFSIAPHETVYIGYGGTVGVTVLLGKIELDLGATYRERPSRVYSKEIIPETLISIGFRWNALIVKAGH